MNKEILTPEDWRKLREKYFTECVDRLNKETDGSRILAFSFAPHDLFEWLKKEIKQMIESENSRQCEYSNGIYGCDLYECPYMNDSKVICYKI